MKFLREISFLETKNDLLFKGFFRSAAKQLNTFHEGKLKKMSFVNKMGKISLSPKEKYLFPRKKNFEMIILPQNNVSKKWATSSKRLGSTEKHNMQHDDSSWCLKNCLNGLSCSCP